MCMFHPGSILQQNPYICRFAMSEVTKKLKKPITLEILYQLKCEAVQTIHSQRFPHPSPFLTRMSKLHHIQIKR